MVGYGPGPQKPAKVVKRLILARLVVAIAITPQRTQPEPPLVRATQQTDGVGVTVPGITVLVDAKWLINQLKPVDLAVSTGSLIRVPPIHAVLFVKGPVGQQRVIIPRVVVRLGLPRKNLYKILLVHRVMRG